MMSSERERKGGEGRGLPRGWGWREDEDGFAFRLYPPGCGRLDYSATVYRDGSFVAYRDARGSEEIASEDRDDPRTPETIAAAQREAESALWRAGVFGWGLCSAHQMPEKGCRICDLGTVTSLPEALGKLGVRVAGDVAEVDAVRAPAPADKAARVWMSISQIGDDGSHPADGDKKPREPGCLCHQEEGDSPCPVHPSEDDEPAPVLPTWLANLTPEAVARINAIPATGPLPWDIADGSLAAAIAGPLTAEPDPDGFEPQHFGVDGSGQEYMPPPRREPKPAPREPSAPTDDELARLLPGLAGDAMIFDCADISDVVREYGKRLARAVALLLAERERMAREPQRPSPDRAAWLLHPVSSTGRQTIAASQYDELRGEAVALRARVAELEAALTAMRAEREDEREISRGHETRADAALARVAELTATPPPHTVAALLARVEEARRTNEAALFPERAKGLETAASLIRATTPSPLDGVAAEVCAAIAALPPGTPLLNIEGAINDRSIYLRRAALALAGMLACDDAPAPCDYCRAKKASIATFARGCTCKGAADGGKEPSR